MRFFMCFIWLNANIEVGNKNKKKVFKWRIIKMITRRMMMMRMMITKTALESVINKQK